ncbi:recombinase family protein [Methylocapsa sp. D3K7]|uniref:recombinase family protein n=1 Tax=Methylocapsa sp. D3K7 TaxID=3041435 RepID=UPI003299E01A
MTKPTLRCAIYTRVSSDQGLEQDFNSLDAQRKAAEAYIKSQAHEGWKLRRDRYDDGGFSGGSMERPALQKLLADIVEGRIDVVVVYKVDRLTRSLADFAKLVELFDAHKVSFVSVTQSFNTTSSMGRLTLNVLLSFAQFEREVGERIRDKIAASKRKGLWMGGVVPLGYRVEARKLLVDEPEAVHVRRIFARYLELGSLPALQRELREEGIRTRSRQLASGKIIGDVSLTNGPLAYILKNRHYLGELNHKGKSYPGDHAAIIPVDLFEAVQRKLAANLNRRDTRRSRSEALLLGKIFDDRGNKMSPSHTLKKGVRYRYYVSSPVVQGRKNEAGSLKRVPAVEIEKLVIGALREHACAGRQATKLTDKELVDTRLGRAVIRSREIEVTLAESPETADLFD